MSAWSISSQQRVLVGGLLQVQHDRALVAVPRHERGALAVDEGRHVARGVASRRLDLDDLGAVVGQQHRAIGAGQVAGQVEDQKMFERAGHDVSSICARGDDATIRDLRHHRRAGRVRRPTLDQMTRALDPVKFRDPVRHGEGRDAGDGGAAGAGDAVVQHRHAVQPDLPELLHRIVAAQRPAGLSDRRRSRALPGRDRARRAADQADRLHRRGAVHEPRHHRRCWTACCRADWMRWC